MIKITDVCTTATTVVVAAVIVAGPPAFVGVLLHQI